MSDVKLELTISAELFAKLEAEAEEQGRTLSQLFGHALHFYLEEMAEMEDTPDDEAAAGLYVGLRQALRGETRDAREAMDELKEKQTRADEAVTLKVLSEAHPG
jgi:hypothetical protein